MDKMSGEPTWSNEEAKALIEIWSDEHLSQLFFTHNNTKVFKLGELNFSVQTAALGLRRSYVKMS